MFVLFTPTNSVVQFYWYDFEDYIVWLSAEIQTVEVFSNDVGIFCRKKNKY